MTDMTAKPAPAEHPIHDLVRARWSPRSFVPEPVPRGTLATLLEAARWAPSCFNAQPWRFLCASRDEQAGFARILGVLNDRNQAWAQHAGALIMAVARERFEHDEQPNRHHGHDLGQALATLTVQATAEGLAVHQMGGFDRDAARAVLGIPEGYAPFTAVAVGTPGPADRLPAALADSERAPRTRKSLAELAFGARWDERLELG